MEHFVAIIDSVAWPVIVFVIFFMLRKPLMGMLPFVENLKYKGLEVSFRKGLEEARAEAKESGFEIKSSSEEIDEIYKQIETSSSYVIVESWKEIELAARDKIIQLVKGNDDLSKAQRHPLTYLELSGTFVPSTVRVIRDLQSLRNLVVHTENLKLSKENVLEYVTLAKAITKQINAIRDLPKQKLLVLTLLILAFNQLIDTGKYNHISIEDIHKQIEDRNIIEYLRKETAGDADFTIFTKDGPFYDYLKYYYEQMHQLNSGYGGEEYKKWGVENSGLCLLVAWTNELVQQGSGWHPLD